MSLANVIRSLIVTVIWLFAGVANTGELFREGECTDLRSELRLTLLADGAVGVDYALSRAMGSLRLGLPIGRPESFRLEPAEASMDADGVVALQHQREDLRMRMNDILVHELVHCYQEPELWQTSAHEGHARFAEYFLGARPDGEYSPDSQVEARFGRNFDGCMKDLQVGKSMIDAYPCGAVEYWLRWLETGRVNMLAKADADNPPEARTMAARFLNRTATEGDVVDFLRSAGIAVQADEDPHSVRGGLIKTLIRQSCGELSSVGYWMHETFVTLDAPSCPELNRFELQTIAGEDIIEDVYLGYAAVAAACRDEGRVPAIGVSGEQKWVNCDRSYAWPSTTDTRYRLVAPFADR